jgi:putative IMPACT (imprinted ancient) family translation regulator
MTLTVDYPNFDRLNHYLTENSVAILDTSYTDQVAVTIAVDLADVTATQTAITNLLSDRLTLTLGDIAYNEVPVEINASSRSDD